MSASPNEISYRSNGEIRTEPAADEADAFSRACFLTSTGVPVLSVRTSGRELTGARMLDALRQWSRSNGRG